MCLCVCVVASSSVSQYKWTVEHWIRARMVIYKHWSPSPNHRPDHRRTRFFSIHLTVWVKPFWLKPSRLSRIMSSTKQNPQNMHCLPRGHWVVAELLVFPSKSISLFYGLVVYREASCQRHNSLCCKRDCRRLKVRPTSVLVTVCLWKISQKRRCETHWAQLSEH